MDRVKPLAVIRVFLFLAGDVTLLFLPMLLPLGQQVTVFRVRRILAERIAVRLFPHARRFQRRKLGGDGVDDFLCRFRLGFGLKRFVQFGNALIGQVQCVILVFDFTSHACCSRLCPSGRVLHHRRRLLADGLRYLVVECL